VVAAEGNPAAEPHPAPGVALRTNKTWHYFSGFSKALTLIHHHLLQITCLIIGGSMLIVIIVWFELQQSGFFWQILFGRKR
jgi:hypothetical protein